MAERQSRKHRPAPKQVGEVKVAYDPVPPRVSVIESAVTRLSSKNQITLPVAMVRMLGLKPGDEISLLAMDGSIYLEKRLEGQANLDRLRGSMAAYPEWSSKEAIDEYIRGERDSWKRPWDPD